MRKSILTVVFPYLFGVVILQSSIYAKERPVLIQNSAELKSQLQPFKEEFILVQFWSPFCAPCGEEISHLNQLLKIANKKKNSLNILGVPIRSRNNEIQAFLTHFKPQYRQWIIDNNSLSNIEILESMRSVPYTLLFDRERKVIKEWHGKISDNDVLSIIKKKEGEN